MTPAMSTKELYIEQQLANEPEITEPWQVGELESEALDRWHWESERVEKERDAVTFSSRCSD